MRTITSDSFCPIQHKLAAYHSAIHRLCQLPLSIANYIEEYKYIKETASVNGYSEKMVDKLVYKHAQKVKNLLDYSLYTERTNTKVSSVNVVLSTNNE